MGGNEKGTCVDDKNSKTDVFAAAIQLVGDVTAEHPRTHDDDVERVTAVAADFWPGAAHPAAKHVVRELSLLDIDLGSGIGIESLKHKTLPFSIAARSRCPRLRDPDTTTIA